MSAPVSGTEGYAEQARELFRRYEAIPASVAHAAVRLGKKFALGSETA